MVTETLKRLRRSRTEKAEAAYTERDEAESPNAARYADGQAHAYGLAADEIHEAEKRASKK
jgi:hypothetical protein